MEKDVTGQISKRLNKSLYELCKARELYKDGTVPDKHELARITARAKTIMSYGQLLLNMTENSLASLQGI